MSETVMRIDLILENDAMQYNDEIARILRDEAKKIMVRGLPENHSVYDSNGNRVGEVVIGEYKRNTTTKKFDFIPR